MTRDPDDEIGITIGGASYKHWIDIDIDSDVTMPADAWSVSGAVPDGETVEAFREGAKCDVYVGRNRQMAGVVDDVTIEINRQDDRLRLSGRDVGAFLVDNEAPPQKVANKTVKQLIDGMLVSSWGVRGVIISNEDNVDLLLGKEEKRELRRQTPVNGTQRPRKSIRIDPGQTIASIITQHCDRVDLTWWITADGYLFIGKPNYNQDVAYYFYSFGLTNRKSVNNNVEKASVKRTINGRYSEIVVNGMGLASKGDAFDTGKSAPRFTGTATDPDLTARGIVRKMILRDTDVLSGAEATNRAKIEMGKRRFDGLVITLTVPGFRDRETQRLYSVDTLASVKIEEAGIDGTYYVSQRRFRENRGTRRTELTLRKTGVWLP